MSAAARTAIATAASTVAGIKCSPYNRQLAKAGEALVRLASVNYPNKFGGEATWEVFVILPLDEKAAEQWLDTNLDALVAALSVEMVVQTVTPVSLRYDTGVERPGVAIQGHREY